MPGLVLEGGTFRPLFSCGVMDALLENDVHFPYLVGVSAGISDSVSYVSKQKGRNLDMIVEFRHDKRYFGLQNLFTEDRSFFGRKFIYETLPNEINPFDFETFRANPAEIWVGVTNAETGEMEYICDKEGAEGFLLLEATCALPIVFPPIVYNGKQYYDGGLVDSIPAKKAIEDGHEKLLIVLTRTEGYVKEESKVYKLAAALLRRKYPKVADLLLTRHIRYNKEVEFCNQLEREGKAVILRPSEDVQIASLESDVEKIKKIYWYGYDLANKNMDKIKALFD